MKKYMIWLSDKIYEKMKHVFINKSQIKTDLSILYPHEKEENREKSYYLNKIGITLKILLTGFVLTIIIAVKILNMPVITEGKYIERNSYGQGNKTVEVIAATKKGKKTLKLEIKEQSYTQKEAEQIFEKIGEKLDKVILKDNHSLDEVRTPLNLVTVLDGLPITIEWELDHYKWMDSSGNILTAQIKPEGEVVSLTAHISYQEMKADYIFSIRILPPILTREESFWQQIEYQINEMSQLTREEDRQLLPTEVNEEAIVWKEKPDATPMIIFFLTVVAAAAIFLGKDYELHTKIDERCQQMVMDYTDILSKFSLLLGAGMTIQGAWEKICGEYIIKKRKSGQFRYAYEEMLVTSRQMQSGVTQLRAYALFGKRCREQHYMKLGTLLEQNIKKGSSGIIHLLDKEVWSAFEERKNLAKKQGEEAGTKLLLPMFLMLSVVMAIIVFPALASLQ